MKTFIIIAFYFLTTTSILSKSINWEEQEVEFCHFLISGLYGEIIEIDKKETVKTINNITTRNLDIVFINKWDNGKPTIHKFRYSTNPYKSKNFKHNDEMYCWSGFVE